ncbi:hypothetical protein BP6252_13116 [Coleophoma cylindrospora]|uniref:Zn(2)-C6 fungal-type domain-containing protein n=1 Tax=Coleophoma cylindrospora TaxID=1849047 RepID=A0A3D8QAE1_9HELO|nr:hypothetical protein BP6252_13116 [Coleophoma cylindrospora]
MHVIVFDRNSGGPIRKRRAGHPKSHTGCITCRIRRVKCDEAKPECNRCQKYFGSASSTRCDGYVSRPEPRGLRPLAAAATARRPNASTGTAVPLGLAPIRFTDGRQAHYFRLFCEETAFDLSSGYTVSFWTGIVLQACYKEPCLRKVVIAIAALTRVLKGGLTSNSEYQDPYGDYSYAVKQYGTSLGEIRAATLNGSRKIRTTLIASILVYCFETFHGGGELALSWAYNAVNLMNNWCTRIAKEDTLLIQSSGLVSKPSSPKPSVVEDDLVDIVKGLDSYISWTDPGYSENPEVVDRMRLENHDPYVTMTFDSLDHARNVLGDICRRSSYYLGHADKSLLLSQRDGLLAELLNWEMAYAPILEAASKNQHTFVPANVLQIHALCGIRGLREYESRGEKILPELSTILDRCRSTVLYPHFKTVFVFDMGIIPPLFLLATRCHDVRICEEALQLLKRIIPRREGVWDAATCLKIGQQHLMNLRGNRSLETDRLTLEKKEEDTHPDMWQKFQLLALD